MDDASGWLWVTDLTTIANNTYRCVTIRVVFEFAFFLSTEKKERFLIRYECSLQQFGLICMDSITWGTCLRSKPWNQLICILNLWLHRNCKVQGGRHSIKAWMVENKHQIQFQNGYFERKTKVLFLGDILSSILPPFENDVGGGRKMVPHWTETNLNVCIRDQW